MKKYNKMMLSVGLTVSLGAMTAFSQPLISVDELGVGTFNGNPLTWQTNVAEPLSGMTTLSYNLPFPAGPGDVVLMEPASGRISDVIRFDGAGHLFFFSDAIPGDPADSLADVGLPGQIAGNPTLIFNEVGPEAGPNGLWGYTPGVNDPGVNTAGAIYDFISDVPEPSSLSLLASGLGIWGYRARRQKLAQA